MLVSPIQFLRLPNQNGQYEVESLYRFYISHELVGSQLNKAVRTNHYSGPRPNSLLFSSLRKQNQKPALF